jgi:hypothetical protein
VIERTPATRMGIGGHPVDLLVGTAGQMVDQFHRIEHGGGEAVARRIAQRGRKAVLDSRRSAARFHTTSMVSQRRRNVGFRLANTVLNLVNRT